MNDNCTVPRHRGPARRGRALFVEALSLSFAREDHRLAALRLRALADWDPQVLALALAQCSDLLRGTPDDPGLRDAVRLLSRAMLPIEGAA
jgi:hypothetical protein